MTTQSFIAQFETELSNADELIRQGILRRAGIYRHQEKKFGVEIYTALQKIVIKNNGKYYIH